MSTYAQNPLHTFPRNFPVDGEVANLIFCCADLQRGNWCNGFCPIQQTRRHGGQKTVKCGLLISSPSRMAVARRCMVIAVHRDQLRGSWD